MDRKITRGQALAAAGAVGLGALLSACGSEGGGQGAVETDAGTTAAIEPQTATSGATAALFDGAPACALTPEQTEGPYWFDVDSIRSDIREDREGALLRLLVRVQDTDGCTPVGNAVVEIWHCDAGGVDSGFERASTGGPGGSGRTDEETYLRGAQVTNADGIVEFRTIYPGWYRGRTVHVHAKVHLDATTVLTTQLYFDEAVTEEVYASSPYSERPGRDTFNDGDMVYAGGAGTPPLLAPTREGDGYLGLVTLGVA